MTHTKEAKDRAKAEGLLMVTFEINGKHAKKCGVGMCSLVKPEHYDRLIELLMEIRKLNAPKKAEAAV